MSKTKSIIDRLELLALTRPNQKAYVFLSGADLAADTITYKQLYDRSTQYAQMLGKDRSLGDRVLIIQPPGHEFLCTLLGCFIAGLTAIPCFPPNNRLTSRTSERFAGIYAKSLSKWTIGPRAILEYARLVVGDDESFIEPPEPIQCYISKKSYCVAHKSDSLAFIQFTSGSTSTPKGVCITHENLNFNLDAISKHLSSSHKEVGCCWLPPYHDMGLISLLWALHSGFPLYYMAPSSFLKRPLCWIEAMSKFKATISVTPNFALDLCSRTAENIDLKNCSLQNLHSLIVGSDTVRGDTLARFSKRFSSANFNESSFLPAYGLAEATLWVAGKLKHEGPRETLFDLPALSKGHVKAIYTNSGERVSKHNRSIVSCGVVSDSIRCFIVDPNTKRPLGPDKVGELWLIGKSVSKGYWQDPENTHNSEGKMATPNGPLICKRTGDMGFLHDNHLYLCGRIKDIIIFRGTNYFAEDLEKTISTLSHSIADNGVCACQFETSKGGEIFIFCEIKRTEIPKINAKQLVALINEHLLEHHDIRVDQIVLVKPGTLARTSSGKLARSLTVKQMQRDTVPQLATWSRSNLKNAEIKGTNNKQAIKLGSLQSIELQSIILHLRQSAACSLGKTLSEVIAEIPLSSLGVDSIAFFEILGAAECKYNVTIPTHLVDQRISLNGLANIIEEYAISNLQADICTDRDIPSTPVVAPLLPAQKRFLGGLSPFQPDGYAITIYLRTPKRISFISLKEWLHKLLRRHEVFKVRFHWKEGHWIQRYEPQAKIFDIKHLILGGLDKKNIRLQSESSYREATKPFDLSKGPLVRIVHHDQGFESNGVLCMVFHHLVIDGFSILNLVLEMNRYAGMLLDPVNQIEIPFVAKSYLTLCQSWGKASNEFLEIEGLRANNNLSADQSLPLSSDLPGRTNKPIKVETMVFSDRIPLNRNTGLRLQKAHPADDMRQWPFLAAVAQAWFKLTKENVCNVEVEQHGRSPVKGIIERRTIIGWLVNYHSLVFSLRMACQGPKKWCEKVREIGEYQSDSLSSPQASALKQVDLRFVYRSSLDDAFRQRQPFQVIQHHVLGQEASHTAALPPLTIYVSKNKTDFEFHARYNPEAYTQDFLSQVFSHAGVWLDSYLGAEIKN